MFYVVFWFDFSGVVFVDLLEETALFNPSDDGDYKIL
jgi:hypothetical protein